MNGLIDTHCHLNYDYAPKSVDDLVREALAAGVETLVTVGTELGTIEEVQRISDRFDNVFHSIGIHPHEASTIGTSEEEIHQSVQKLEKASLHPKCRAIGEIGLDYHYDHSPRELQIRATLEQLELARRRALPVIVHSREGEAELLPMLENYAKALPAESIPGILHCFSGTREFGEACLKLGFYISFSGILTFKNAEDLRNCAQAFPMERLLVETDSPYLAPIPHRGKKCEPSMVRFTAQKLAEVKGLSLEEVAAATTRNARKVLKLAP